MRKQKGVKCMLLALLTVALAIPAGISVMASTGTEESNVIQYRGRSLRIDTEGSKKTSLRFGYTITLPEGAAPASEWERGTDWISWEYTMDGKNPEDSSVQANKKVQKAVNVVKNDDGSYTANLVITGIPSDYYRRTFYAKMAVQYRDKEAGPVTLEEDVWRSTTIKDVSDTIIKTEDSEDPTYQADKEYAETLQKELGKYSAMAGDRMYGTLPEAINKVKTGGTVSVLKITGVTEAITIDKAVILENDYGTSATVKDVRDVKESSMITVASGGKLTIAGNGLTILGDIKAEGDIILEKGTVNGKVVLSDINGGVSLSVGKTARILDGGDGNGGLAGAHEPGAERTAPLLTLQDGIDDLPQIYISETKADTEVMDIPETLFTNDGIQEEQKNKLTCADSIQLMWGPYGEAQKTVTVKDAEAHIHCACGENTKDIGNCGTGHWDIEYGELTSDTKAHLGGNYYLPSDITIGNIGNSSGYYDMASGVRYGTGNLNLCLNGYTLTGVGTKRIIYAASYNNKGSTVNVTGICPATGSDIVKKVDVSDGTVSIQYGTLKRTGTANLADTAQYGRGGCLYNDKNSEVRLYNVYMDGSECEYTGTSNGATMYNLGKIRILNCLISKHPNNAYGAYNGNSGVLPYIDDTKNVRLYEFPQQ